MLAGYPSAAFSVAAHRLPQSIMDTTLDALPGAVQCADVVAATRKDSAEEVLAGLPPRQRQVIKGIARGLTNKEIAREQGLTEGTIKVHARLAYTALDMHSRTAIAARFGDGSTIGKPRAALSAKVRHVVIGVRDGLDNQQISDRLGVSLSTVKTRVKRAFDATGLKTRSGLAAWAARNLPAGV